MGFLLEYFCFSGIALCLYLETYVWGWGEPRTKQKLLALVSGWLVLPVLLADWVFYQLKKK